MIGRNDICICGSGLKHKKCCLNKKARSTKTKLNFDRPVTPDNLRIDPSTGDMAIYSGNRRLHPSSVSSEESYPRDGGKPNKVISKVFGMEDAQYAKPLKHLNAFDCVYAVDTNYRIINGVKVCAAGITRGEKLQVDIPRKTAYRVTLKYGLVFSTKHPNPERIAWGFVADQSRHWEDLQNKNVGLIVDSELGALDGISQRKDSLFQHLYLPPNFKIMYASADAEKGNPMNKMINISDYGATLMLNELFRQLGDYDVTQSPIQMCLCSITQNKDQITINEMPIVNGA